MKYGWNDGRQEGVGRRKHSPLCMKKGEQDNGDNEEKLFTFHFSKHM